MNWKPAGKLVIEDGAVRFMDNFLWATVYEEASLLPPASEYRLGAVHDYRG